jgi:SAM-dependent MidA family methyltransferase
MKLPEPTPAARAHSEALQNALIGEISAHAGWIPFSHFMATALYEPGLGYYAAGARKFGSAGDFVTAPEMSQLFGETLAGFAADLMAQTQAQILEVGAGSGRLAVDVLAELAARNTLPERYAILELSADLRQRQREKIAAALPQLIDRVQWLDVLPDRFDGLVIGNEVLDAMPIEMHLVTAEGLLRRGVAVSDGRFVWEDRLDDGPSAVPAQELCARHELPAGYLLETCPSARAWMRAWGERLGNGAVLLFDYGFPEREYYHPQRAAGTLMCHYRHLAHGDPFVWPGLQDITAHVDFTAMARAAHGAGLSIYGYTSQAAFLLEAGLLDRLAALPQRTPSTLRETGAVQKLLSPAEMGELFKVMLVGRGLSRLPAGFGRGGRLHAL